MIKSVEELKIFYDGLDHPEGVAVHADGSVWAGGEGGQIYRISPDGDSMQEMANTGGFILGIAFSPDMRWLAICDVKKQALLKLDLETNQISILSTGVPGRKLINPNFPVFDRQGNLYVSDSGNFRQVNGVIFKFSPDGSGALWHEGPFSFCNGMAMDASQENLYIACTFLPGIEKLPVNADGSAGERQTLIEMPETCPDGLAFDEEENLYISCYAPNIIFRLDKAGSLEKLVYDWESHTICNPTNIAFGGPDRKTLFIANLGRWHITRLQMDIPGLSLIA